MSVECPFGEFVTFTEKGKMRTTLLLSVFLIVVISIVSANTGIWVKMTKRANQFPVTYQIWHKIV